VLLRHHSSTKGEKERIKREEAEKWGRNKEGKERRRRKGSKVTGKRVGRKMGLVKEGKKGR